MNLKLLGTILSDEHTMFTNDVPFESKPWQERLSHIMETMRELSTQTDPQEMVQQYYKRMRQVNPHIDRRLALSRRGLTFPRYRVTRFSEWKDPINPWKEPGKLPILSGGILAELIYSNEPRIISNLVLAPNDPAQEYLEGMHSLQAIPLLENGEAVNMTFHAMRSPNGFSEEHLPEAVWLANLFGRATNNLVLAERVKAAYEEVDRELRAVASIQRSLLPAQLPNIPGLKLAAHYQTARRAGGDYYDFFPLPDGSWGLLIADVSGHGTPAAVMMAVTHSIAHSYSGPPHPPSEMLNYLNTKLCEHYFSDSGTFITAFYAIYQPTTRVLTYSSAGHNPPRRRSCDRREITALDKAQRFPLGVIASMNAIDAEVQLHLGDQLIFYTDGIVEASNPDGLLFGTNRMDAELSRCSSDPESIIASLLTALESHTCDAPPSDDRTVIVAKVVEAHINELVVAEAASERGD